MPEWDVQKAAVRVYRVRFQTPQLRRKQELNHEKTEAELPIIELSPTGEIARPRQ